MADFSAPYRAFPPVDPAAGGLRGTNALMRWQQMGQQRDAQNERINLMKNQQGMQQEQLGMDKQRFEFEKLAVPVKFAKEKASHVGEIAAQLSRMPKAQRDQKYADLVTKVVPTPLIENSPLGPLGAANPDDFLKPEEFSRLSDADQQKYLDGLYMDAKSLTQMKLEDIKQGGDLQKLKVDNDYRLARIRKQLGADIGLENVKHQNAMEEIGAKGAGKGGTEGGPVEFKAADNAPFFKALEPLYKFEIGADGNLRFGGSEQEGRELLAIVDKAQELYKKGGLTHAQAAKKAAEEFGKEFPSPVGAKSKVPPLPPGFRMDTP